MQTPTDTTLRFAFHWDITAKRIGPNLILLEKVRRNNNGFSQDDHQNMLVNFKRLLIGREDVMNEDAKGFDVIRADVASHKLILLHEVDALSSDGSEVKLCLAKNVANESNYHMKVKFYQQKMLDMWLTSQIAGIPRALVGVRSEDGVLTDLKEYPMDDDQALFDIIRAESNFNYFGKNDNQDPWDRTRCFEFLRDFLDYVKNQLMDRQDMDHFLQLKFSGLGMNRGRSMYDTVFVQLKSQDKLIV